MSSFSQTTNDNSNPQQGTGESLLTVPIVSESNTQQSAPPRRAHHKVPPTKKDDRKLFVGGLPANITEEEFLSFFAQFGSLIDSVVMFDRETKRSRGFGFVTYEDQEVVERMLLMGNDGADPDAKNLVGRVEMQGKMCEIKRAQPKDPGSRGRFNREGSARGFGGKNHNSRANSQVHHQHHQGQNMFAVPPVMPMHHYPPGDPTIQPMLYHQQPAFGAPINANMMHGYYPNPYGGMMMTGFVDPHVMEGVANGGGGGGQPPIPPMMVPPPLPPQPPPPQHQQQQMVMEHHHQNVPVYPPTAQPAGSVMQPALPGQYLAPDNDANGTFVEEKKT